MRVLIVEDHPIVRRGMRSLLASQPDFQVIWEAADAYEALQKVTELSFDVILMDMSLPGLNGIEITCIIKQLSPRSEVLFVSQHAMPGMIAEALNAGGRGYVVKSDAGRELIEAVRTVAQHTRFLSSSCMSMLPSIADPECNVGSSES